MSDWTTYIQRAFFWMLLFSVVSIFVLLIWFDTFEGGYQYYLSLEEIGRRNYDNGGTFLKELSGFTILALLTQPK